MTHPQPSPIVDEVAERNRRGPDFAFPMDTAPKDGSILRLLVKFDRKSAAGAFEDTTEPSWTIGTNNMDNTDDDQWDIVGWSWEQDVFCHAYGATAIGWLPFHTESAEPALVSPPKAGEAEPVVVRVKEMKLGGPRPAGSTADYFVSIRVGNREVTPHCFRERFKAEYHVALYDWLLNGGEKPDLMAFDENDWPAGHQMIEQPTQQPRVDGVRVCALEWQAYGGRWRASSPGISVLKYIINPDRGGYFYVSVNGQPLTGKYATSDSAKGAAQSHFDAAIRSALASHAPAIGETQPGLSSTDETRAAVIEERERLISEVMRRARNLIGSSRGFIDHFNPTNMAEDKSQQWFATYDAAEHLEDDLNKLASLSNHGGSL